MDKIQKYLESPCVNVSLQPQNKTRKVGDIAAGIISKLKEQQTNESKTGHENAK